MREEQLQRAVELLRTGGVVAFPTDTVYGLGADGLNPQAVRRVFAVKRRPWDMPLPLLLADMAMLRSVVERVPDSALALAQRFFPGPLTIVLKKAAHVPSVVTAGRPHVAVRIPAHPVPLRLAGALERPLVGTSANRSGLPSPTTAAEVREQLGDEVDYVIEGLCPGGVESTVIDLTEDPPKILREGAVPVEALEAALGVKCQRAARSGAGH